MRNDPIGDVASIPKFYELYGQSDFGEYYKNLLRRLAVGESGRSFTCLDLACGAGHPCIKWLKDKQVAMVCGVDRESDLIEKAKKERLVCRQRAQQGVAVEDMSSDEEPSLISPAFHACSMIFARSASIFPSAFGASTVG